MVLGLKAYHDDASVAAVGKDSAPPPKKNGDNHRGATDQNPGKPTSVEGGKSLGFPVGTSRNEAAAAFLWTW